MVDPALTPKRLGRGLPRSEREVLSQSGLTAMSSSEKSKPTRRTHDARNLKEVVAELRLYSFVLARAEKHMHQLDDNDAKAKSHNTKAQRDNVIQCLAVAIEGLALVEQMADNVVTDISGYAIHHVWERGIREQHRAEHRGPPSVMPPHHWLLRAEDAAKLKTPCLLRLGRQATGRMSAALTTRRETWRPAKPTDKPAAAAGTAAAAAAGPSKRGPPETALVAVASAAGAVVKRSRRLQSLDYPRPVGRHYVSQGDVCTALDAAVEGLTDPGVRQQKLRSVKNDMIEKQYVVMGLRQINRWYAKWNDPNTRHSVPTNDWAVKGPRTRMKVGAAQQLFEQRASTGEKVKGHVFQIALRDAANKALDEAGLASKPEVRAVVRILTVAAPVTLPLR
jgi:hypothetical protein